MSETPISTFIRFSVWQVFLRWLVAVSFMNLPMILLIWDGIFLFPPGESALKSIYVAHFLSPYFCYYSLLNSLSYLDSNLFMTFYRLFFVLYFRGTTDWLPTLLAISPKLMLGTGFLSIGDTYYVLRASRCSVLVFLGRGTSLLILLDDLSKGIDGSFLR